MPSILVCGSEGEWGLFNNVLSLVGADDKRRGSMLADVGSQAVRNFASSDDCWVHVRMAAERAAGTTPGTVVSPFLIRDSAGRTICGLSNRGQSSSVQHLGLVYKDAGTGGALTEHPDLYPNAHQEFHNYDFNVKKVGSTTVLTVYRDEVMRFQQTLSVALSAYPAQIVAQTKNNAGGYADMWYQDVVVTDGIPTVGMELATLVPAAVGAYNEFTNDYTNISQPGYDHSTVVASTVAGQRESWIFSEPEFDLGDKVIYAIVLSAVAQSDLNLVVTDFKPFLRIGAVEYDQAPLGMNNVAPGNYLTVITTNPSTSQPWVEADLIALEAGLLSI